MKLKNITSREDYESMLTREGESEALEMVIDILNEQKSREAKKAIASPPNAHYWRAIAIEHAIQRIQDWIESLD